MARAFLGLATRDPVRRAAFATQIRRDRPRLADVYDTGAVMVAARDLICRTLPGRTGIILGRLSGAVDTIMSGPFAGGGDGTFELSGVIGTCWGGYVAIVRTSSGAMRILRAPLGDLPVYYAKDGDAVYFASAPGLLLRATGARADVAWRALARHLALSNLRTAETCLAGIDELPGGDCLTVAAGQIQRTTLWSPWRWVDRRCAIDDPGVAAVRLRETAQACVCAATDGHESVLLKLSGGLDSSIVAACLARSRQRFGCLTLVTDDSSGDERHYARIVADHIGAPLIERRRDPTRVDLTISPARYLPRPSLPGFRQESERLSADAARDIGASLVLDGGGGDNVFCSLQSARVVADCLRRMAGLRHVGDAATSVAALAQVSTAMVIRAALRCAMRRSNRYRWSVDLRFLSRQACANVPLPPAHPWLEASGGALPGRAAHVALIAAAQSYVEGLDPERNVPLVAPLLAQPLVELCLRIPSWLWVDRGLNRAAARHAFADDLPDTIVRRRSKGSPDAFVAQLFETNREMIRAHLLGGMLAARDMLDLPPLATVLNGDAPPRDHDLQRLMTLVDAETWCRHWQA